MADAYHPKKPSISNMNSIRLKTNELLMHNFGCHGKLVSIAAMYMAEAYRPKEHPYQIWTQYDLRQRSYNVKCI